MDKKIKFIIGSVIWSCFALFVGVQTFLQYQLVAHYKEDYPVTAKARIEFVGRSTGSGTLSFPLYTATYLDSHNHPHRIKNSTRMDQLYQVGDSLNIRYQADNPEESIIDDSSQLENYFIRGLCTFMLLVALNGYIIYTAFRLHRLKK